VERAKAEAQEADNFLAAMYRTHPGLEKRETWGTHSYLIMLPKIKDGSGQETRATRPEHLPPIAHEFPF
jgi:hypothetical protein